MEKINDISLFMLDDSESDKKELVIDYFLSWTLRCASEENTNTRFPLVNKYAKTILEILLGLEYNTLGQIKSVKTWKQCRQIDLWVEIETSQGNHALLIETKAYTNVHSDQLKRYKETFENHYEDKDFQKHYCLFTITDNDKVSNSDIEECKKNNFNLLTMDDVYDRFKSRYHGKLQLTGSDLFDEFWLGRWG